MRSKIESWIADRILWIGVLCITSGVGQLGAAILGH